MNSTCVFPDHPSYVSDLSVCLERAEVLSNKTWVTFHDLFYYCCDIVFYDFPFLRVHAGTRILIYTEQAIKPFI